MKQKTAMQEAFEHLNLWLESGMAAESWLIKYKNGWLEKEKEQIMDGFINGDKTDCMEHEDIRGYAEDYYNETYKQD